jgi:hypothetical protein
MKPAALLDRLADWCVKTEARFLFCKVCSVVIIMIGLSLMLIGLAGLLLP